MVSTTQHIAEWSPRKAESRSCTRPGSCASSSPSSAAGGTRTAGPQQWVGSRGHKCRPENTKIIYHAPHCIQLSLAHRHNSVTAPDHGVAVVIVPTPVGAAAHADHPPGLGHLVIHLPEGGGHLVGQSPRHDDHIGLARGGSEHNSISKTNYQSSEFCACWMSAHLSMSYLGAAMCIISTAQHARPKVRGHREPWSK